MNINKRIINFPHPQTTKSISNYLFFIILFIFNYFLSIFVFIMFIIELIDDEFFSSSRIIKRHQIESSFKK